MDVHPALEGKCDPTGVPPTEDAPGVFGSQQGHHFVVSRSHTRRETSFSRCPPRVHKHLQLMFRTPAPTVVAGRPPSPSPPTLLPHPPLFSVFLRGGSLRCVSGGRGRSLRPSRRRTGILQRMKDRGTTTSSSSLSISPALTVFLHHSRHAGFPWSLASRVSCTTGSKNSRIPVPPVPFPPAASPRLGRR